MVEREKTSHTLKELKYDPLGNFEVYRSHVQRTMEKPYPDNGGFYGLGCLREAGLRRSRHVGSFRTKSEYLNKEEPYRQPLHGSETVLDRGTIIRSSGGLRQPAEAPDAPGSANADRWQPGKHSAAVEDNLNIIRGMCKALPLPKEVARRRNLEAELNKASSLDGLPEWSLKFVYKLFRNYSAPYPLFTSGIKKSHHLRSAIDDTTSFFRDDNEEQGSALEAKALTSSLTKPQNSAQLREQLSLKLRIEVIKGEDIPKMDATGLSTREGCDPYIVFRYGGLERFRSQVQHETYNPVWNEAFTLDLEAGSREPLILQVWDEDETCNELVGQTIINFVELRESIRLERWHALTAENYKAFRAVQAKSDTTHAGQILLALTLHQHNDRESTPANQDLDDPDVERSVQRSIPWGYGFESEQLLDRKLLTARDLLSIVLEKLQLVLRGINVTAKPHLFSALDSLLISQKRKIQGNTYDSRMFLEQAVVRARRVIDSDWQESEDKILACKVFWSATCLIHEVNARAALTECSKLFSRLEQWPDLQSALDDELSPSDHDRKDVRSSDPVRCFCTENHPGARSVRHKMLSDIRNISSAMVEELPAGPQPLRFRRTPRENTTSPGINGRDVDVCLELLSTASPLCLEGHYQAINAVAVSENLVFSASSDQTIRVWDLTTLKCVEVLDLHHHGRVNCLCVGPGYNSIQLYSGSDDMTIKSFNISTSTDTSVGRTPCTHTLRHHKGPVQSLCINEYIPKETMDRTEKGWRLYSGSADRRIHVYKTAFIGVELADPNDPQPIAILEGHTSTITTIAVARERIYSGSLDTTVRVWDLHTFSMLMRYSLEGDIVNSLSINCGRMYLGTSDQDIHVLDAGDLTLLTKLEGHSAYVFCLAGAISTLPLRISDYIQVTHPLYKMPENPRVPLSYESYRRGQVCRYFSRVTIGIRKAKDVEAADISPGSPGSSDPEARVEIGGTVRIDVEGGQGMKYDIEKKSARTKVLKQTLKPRWNETFTFIIPEVPDRLAPSGSSVASVPLTVSLWDWNVTGYDSLGYWTGTLGQVMKHPITGEVPTAGADGSGEPDGEDKGGWLYLRPIEAVVGKEVPASEGLRVGLSAEGREWIEDRGLEDESGGMFGTIGVVAQDGLSCRVTWEKSKGAFKNGQRFPGGWQSSAVYNTGRYDKYYLVVWDDRPREHGAVMIFCHVAPPVRGEEDALAPHRALVVSGSDDETVRAHDLASHACVSVLERHHTNKVSALAVTPRSNRLVSASQDCTLKIW